MLWAWEGLAPREIATVTGLTPNAVSIRLHKAKKALAAALGKTAPHAGHKRDTERRPR
jgi:RNA polymerase sigma-70 factor (ECF subfamily)